MRDSVWMAGQKMLAGFDGTEVTGELRRAVRKHKIGNVILFQRNVVDAAQLRTLCGELRALIEEETGLPPLIAIDQEGGVVTRLGPDSAVTPSAMALAATGDPESALIAGRIIGRELSAMGVNFDLAPVLDVNSNPLNPVIGARSFGDDPAQVAAFGCAMIRGIQESGVLACAKHFPGHGDTAVDSHLGLPRVDKSRAELEACELVPFRAAVKAGVAAVMSSHILFPMAEEGMPATLSRRVMTGLLREELGFEGLIVSDCLMMSAIAHHHGVVPGCATASEAGIDLICVSHSLELAGAGCEAIASSVDAAELEASALRIEARKKRLPPPGDLSTVGCEEHRQAVRALREASVTRVGAEIPDLGDRPLFVGCRAYQAAPVSNLVSRGDSFPEWLRDRLGGTALVTASDPEEGEIARAAELARQASCVVVGTYNGHLRRGQLELVRALGGTGLPMVCVALRDPYDLKALPPHACGLAVYEYSEESLAVVAGALRGEVSPRGRMSVRLEGRA